MQFSTAIYTLPNSSARLTECRKLTIVQTETTIEHIIKHKTQLNSGKYLQFTFWHSPGIEPGTFRSQVGQWTCYMLQNKQPK